MHGVYDLGMTKTSYTAGQTIEIAGDMITLGTRNRKWTWFISGDDISAEMYFMTAEEAIEHAGRTLGGKPCQHKIYGWCPDCSTDES